MSTLTLIESPGTRRGVDPPVAAGSSARSRSSRPSGAGLSGPGAAVSRPVSRPGAAVSRPARRAARALPCDRTRSAPGSRAHLGSVATVPRAASRLHLTRRGQVLLLVLAVLAVAVAFSVGRVSAAAAPSGPAPTVTVTTGDTLWSVAARAEPAADTRAAVADLVALNGLDEELPLHAGQVLVLPRS